jgi:uncharacterized membrane protein YeiH
VIFVLSLFATFVLRMMSRVFSERTLLVADAIGLGLFSISGTSVALDARMPPFRAVMMGVVTGVFGGIGERIAAGRHAAVLISGSIVK